MEAWINPIYLNSPKNAVAINCALFDNRHFNETKQKLVHICTMSYYFAWVSEFLMKQLCKLLLASNIFSSLSLFSFFTCCFSSFFYFLPIEYGLTAYLRITDMCISTHEHFEYIENESIITCLRYSLYV